MSTYEAWRISYQSSEQAARSAWGEIERLRARVAELEANQRMSNERARGVLAHMDHAGAVSIENAVPMVAADAGRKFSTLDGEFTADDLDALACWMRDPKGVAGE